jgi:NAD(P)-dependent dehydrogenase (short-subunit alcohol dehydrogenase family)
MNPKYEFLGKNVVVTGASSGIGQSAAIYFLNSGANVILAGRDVKTMESFCKKNNFKNATIMKVDLRDDIQVYDFKSSIVENFQKIDILINCAGIKLDGDVEKTYPQDFDYSIDINLRSIFLILRLFERYFTQGASIINLSCLYGTRPMCGVISYAMSKAGLETLTKYAAADYASLGIRINAITACPVDTNSFGYINVSEEEQKYFKKKMEKDIPLGRIARPDDIVKVIAFLASKRSEKITGQVIKVDGGRSLTSSGYVHYRGMKNMNSRFEPDGPKFTTWLGDMFSSNQKMDKLIQNETELKQFVEENINQSNFSTRLTDAHKNVNASYKIVDANEDLLKDRYLKGNTPNILLEKKGNRQGKMSYNEGLFPIQQFPETKGSLMYSPVNNKVEEENINNINNINNENDFGYDENDFNVEDNNENENEGMKENNRY